MRDIKLLIVHGAATPADMDIGVEEIRKWHTDPKPDGRGWSDIGYHFVIRRDGTIENGRAIERVGAHVRGQNNNSIGICLVGSGWPRPNYTVAQYIALHGLIHKLRSEYPRAHVAGHYEFSSTKPHCPGFDVPALFSQLEQG